MNNPIKNLVSDESLEKLLKEGLLTGIGIRNYLIRKEYKELMFEYNSTEAINILMEKYCLGICSLRNILYSTRSYKQKSNIASYYINKFIKNETKILRD